jgi:type II secretory pathway pseudopilin PulG
MKGTKTSLFLVELIISLLLFSFCAAICIQIFNAASKRARDGEALNRAVFLAEQAAELYKAAGGDIAKTSESYRGGGVPIYSGGVMKVYYDETWSEALNPIFSAAIGDAAKYELRLSEANDGAAEVTVSERPNGVDGSKIIFSINVKAVA